MIERNSKIWINYFLQIPRLSYHFASSMTILSFHRSIHQSLELARGELWLWVKTFIVNYSTVFLHFSWIRRSKRQFDHHEDHQLTLMVRDTFVYKATSPRKNGSEGIKFLDIIPILYELSEKQFFGRPSVSWNTKRCRHNVPPALKLHSEALYYKG